MILLLNDCMMLYIYKSRKLWWVCYDSRLWYCCNYRGTWLNCWSFDFLVGNSEKEYFRALIISVLRLYTVIFLVQRKVGECCFFYNMCNYVARDMGDFFCVIQIWMLENCTCKIRHANICSMTFSNSPSLLVVYF